MVNTPVEIQIDDHSKLDRPSFSSPLPSTGEQNLRDDESERTRVLEAALSAAGMGVLEWDLRTGAVYCSPRFLHSIGIHGFTGTFTDFERFLQKSDVHRLANAMSDAIESKGQISLDFSIGTSERSMYPVTFIGCCEYQSENTPSRLIGTLQRRVSRTVAQSTQDITERRLAEVDARVGEQRLRESEERYRLALDAAEQGSWKYDYLTQGLWIDDRCREQNGFESVRPNRQNALAMLHPEDARRLFEAGKRAQEDPERDGSFSAEYRIHRPDGSLRWISLAARIQFDESSSDRKPLQINGTTRDVTQRKRAEAIVQRQSVVLEQIAIGAPLASILQKVVDLVEEQVPGTYCAIYIADLKQNQLQFITGNNLPADYCRAVQLVPIGPDEGTCGTAAYLKKKVVASDISQDRLWAKYRELALKFGLWSCSSTPIMDSQESGGGAATGNVLGTLCLYRKDSLGLNTEADEIVATAVHLAKLAIERENAFLALRESEARYFAISEITRSVTFAFRYSADGAVKIEWVRPRFGLLSGYSEDECNQFGWKILFRAEDHERLERLFRKVAKGRSVRGEFQLVTKSGEALTVLVQGRLLTPASDSDERVIVGGLIDITELKSVEVALRESEERFQLAMRGANDGLWDWNMASQQVYLSPRWKAMLGYAEHELVDQISTWLQLLHPEDVAKAKSVVADFLSGDSEIYESAFRMRHKSGEYRTILSRGFALRDDRGDPMRMVGTHQDVTDRMLADQELRTSRQQLETLSRQLISAREEELRHLARELHDEIGQQLTLMKMNLRNIQRDADESIRSRLDENIQMIEQAVEQVRNLSLNMRPPHLDDLGLVATLHWYLKKQAALAGFEERLTVIPSDVRVPIDLATVCFRITQEAVTNAIRHARPASIEIELRCESGMLQLTIRDDGCGFNVADARKRALEGTSLGIISMQERAKLTGGETEITSTIGRGTEVCARFPLKSC